MKPLLIVAMTGGSMTGIFASALFGSGLRAPASPRSIFAVLIATLGESFIGIIFSVITVAAMSFTIAAIIPRASRKRDLEVLANGGHSDRAQHLSVYNFMASPKYDEVMELVRKQQA